MCTPWTEILWAWQQQQSHPFQLVLQIRLLSTNIRYISACTRVQHHGTFICSAMYTDTVLVPCGYCMGTAAEVTPVKYTYQLPTWTDLSTYCHCLSV